MEKIPLNAVPAAPAAPSDPATTPMHTINITMFQSGALQVTGPLDNPIIAYGLLEAARDVVRASIEDQQKKNNGKPRIQIPLVTGLVNRLARRAGLSGN